MLDSMSLDEVVDEGTRRLAEARIDHADYEAQQLFAVAAGISTSDLRLWKAMGETIEENLGFSSASTSSAERSGASRDDTVARFRELVERRENHEPLQYLLGSVGFRYIEVDVGRGVFIPRPETETVTQAAIDWLQQQDITIPIAVDLCAGSGVIGLSIATEVSHCCVVGVESDKKAYAWLNRNYQKVEAQSEAAGNGPLLYKPVCADATFASTLAALDGTVDCVVSNPPYVPLVMPPTQPEVAYDPEVALFGGSLDGMAIPQALVKRAAVLLRPGGFLVMEHDISQPATMRTAMQDAGFVNIENHDDLTGRPRFTTAFLPDAD